MLYALGAIMRRRGLTFRCFHVNHNMRSQKESLEDALAVKALGRSLGIPLRVATIPPGAIAELAKKRRVGLEAAARILRHRAWRAEAARIGAARVLVAHTRDDQLETLLMRILRGSGPGGLALMPRDAGLVLRPLLGLDRAQVLAYLAERGASYREDASNRDVTYLRNRIRHILIPLLDQWFPFWKNSLLALAETQGLTADFLRSEAEKRLFWTPESPSGFPLVLKGADFLSHPQIIREEALFLGIDRLQRKTGSLSIPRRNAARLFSRREAPRGKGDFGPVIAEFRGDRLVLSPREDQGERGFSLLIKEPGVYKISRLMVNVIAGTPEFRGIPTHIEDTGRLFAEPPLVLRSACPGDAAEARKAGIAWKKALERFRLQGGGEFILAEDPQGILGCILVSPGKPVLFALGARRERGSLLVSLDGLDVETISVKHTGGLHGQQ